MRRPRITPAHLSLALASVAATTAYTAWATANGHHTNTGAWTGPVVAGWLLMLLSFVWVLVVGCWGLARLVVRLLPPKGRPAPGEGLRKPSPSPDEWAAWDLEYATHRRNARIADIAMREPGEDDTQLMLLSDIAELDGPSLIDAFDAYGIAPERVVRAKAEPVVDVPPSQREYPARVPLTVWAVKPEALAGQGAALRAWFGDAFEQQGRWAA